MSKRTWQEVAVYTLDAAMCVGAVWAIALAVHGTGFIFAILFMAVLIFAS